MAPDSRDSSDSRGSSGRATVRDAVDGALEAYAALQEVAEEVEDEWTYVQDLTAAHRSRLDAIAATDGDDPIEPSSARAIETACDEIALVTDPHRAIDWLSTFPSVVAIALGRAP
jgi:hypothetical protein